MVLSLILMNKYICFMKDVYSFPHLKHILHQQPKVSSHPQHKLRRRILFATFNSTDCFNRKSGSVGDILLGDATIFACFFKIINNRHVKPFFRNLVVFNSFLITFADDFTDGVKSVGFFYLYFWIGWIERNQKYALCIVL